MKRSLMLVNDDKAYENAIRQREVFYGKPVRNETRLSFGWPRKWRHIGKTNAQIYYSDKMLNGGKPELYKHIQEARQELFINNKNTKILDDEGQLISFRDPSRKSDIGFRNQYEGDSVFYAPAYEINGTMPQFVSDLADNKGIQWQTPDGKYHEIRIPNTTLASAVHPETGETFLLVYSDEGVHLLIWGSKLGIGKHGIYG